jgi:ABC-2 type transport system permease protein
MNTLAGTGTLTRLVVRRDRVRLAVFALVHVGIPMANTASLAALMPTPQARADFVAESAANPIISALLGPILSPSIESIVAWRSNVQCLLVVAVASLLLVVRHTRADEDAGRRELLGSNPVGRHAGLAAVLGVVCAANLLIALVLAVAFVAVAGYPAAGSFLFALSFAGVGWCFAAVAATAAQLGQTAVVARNYSFGILAAAMVPVLVSEGGTTSWMTWLSPVGWTRATRPYAGDHWAVLLIPVVVAAGLTVIASALSARRDVGAGVLPDRSRGIGPSRAAPALRGPLALAWRLHKDQLVGWGVGLGVVGVTLGWGATSFDELFADMTIMADWLSTMGAATIGQGFLAVLSFDFRLIVVCLAVVTALRMRGEELRGHVDPLLAGPTSRARWLRSHVIVAFVGPTAIVVALGCSAGLAYGVATGRLDAVADQVGAALLFLPAMWFMTALTVALFGLVPRAVVAASWAVLGALVIVVLLWEVRAIDESVFIVTPFAYSHPAVDAGLGPPIVFTVLAGVLTAVGASAFGRRDVGA